MVVLVLVVLVVVMVVSKLVKLVVVAQRKLTTNSVAGDGIRVLLLSTQPLTPRQINITPSASEETDPASSKDIPAKVLGQTFL